ncbi:MAG TPA: hypothetical protein PKU97_20775, partial [Kofleriaceae bacterium]|nr:hypothetical protein [Kofleriaceae bacterium]
MAWLGSSCVALLGLCAGCVSGDVTDLVPEGPPMIRQLILTERYPSGSASLTRPVIAFGTHRDASSDEQHVVSAALVENQRLRVVMDELLLGNRLEELQCNEQVDEDAFARVPAGATPDDLARCSGDPEALRATCKGAKAVCVRSSDGVAVGILDRLDTNGQPRPDGVPDVVRFIDGAALVRCTAAAVDRDVPASQSLSYWQPAGSQVRHDIDDGFRGFLLLGPAVVLVPRHALPTGSACHVRFAEDVVDKSGLRPCA